MVRASTPDFAPIYCEANVASELRLQDVTLARAPSERQLVRLSVTLMRWRHDYEFPLDALSTIAVFKGAK